MITHPELLRAGRLGSDDCLASDLLVAVRAAGTPEEAQRAADDYTDYMNAELALLDGATNPNLQNHQALALIHRHAQVVERLTQPQARAA